MPGAYFPARKCQTIRPSVDPGGVRLALEGGEEDEVADDERRAEHAAGHVRPPQSRSVGAADGGDVAREVGDEHPAVRDGRRAVRERSRARSVHSVSPLCASSATSLPVRATAKMRCPSLDGLE